MKDAEPKLSELSIPSPFIMGLIPMVDKLIKMPAFDSTGEIVKILAPSPDVFLGIIKLAAIGTVPIIAILGLHAAINGAAKALRK